MFLGSFDIDLTLGEIHRSRQLGDIVGPLVKE